MSETIEMSVSAARAVLTNVRGLSNEQIEEAQRVVNAFYAAKPRKQCVACGSMIWSEHTADGDACWACDRCHRSPDLTAEEWRAAEADRQQAAEARLRAADAAEPAPREKLRERLEALVQARAAAEKLEKAVPVARSNVWAAQERVEAAEAAAEEANQGAATNLAEALTTGKPIGPASSAAKARAALAEAVDAVVLAKNGRTILESRLTDAKAAVAFAMDKVRKSCLQVIAEEKTSDLLGAAISARAKYLDAIGGLAWLLRSHAIDDAGVRQFVSEAGTPPSSWPESATAGAAACETAMNALLGSADAVI